MSIEVENLSKVYGNQIAVNEISFSIGKGEIVGFLGPNGAGKSTTMKILTCYLPASSGSAKVCGLNVVTNSLQVREKIGYLPEHNPLYLDMFVKEYLTFFGELSKVKNLRARVKEIIEITGLQREQHKKIGQLSKGYRQRVGLAQAIIHNPEVLILDEPTSGLDPNQVIEIRDLIKTLGKEKTIMISTHIMQEVEQICDKVIIIDKGNIVAHDTLKNLKSKSNKNTQIVKIQFGTSINADELKTIDSIVEIDSLGDNAYRLEGSKENFRQIVSQFALRNNYEVLELISEQQSLEQVFRNITSTGGLKS